jgi:hypothetical protein
MKEVKLTHDNIFMTEVPYVKFKRYLSKDVEDNLYIRGS